MDLLTHENALTVVTGVVGWFVRVLWEAVKEQRMEIAKLRDDDLARLREEIPRTYMRRDDFKEEMGEIREMFREIRDTLSRKVDKP